MIERIKKFIAIIKLKRQMRKYYKNMTPEEQQADSTWAEFAMKQLTKLYEDEE